MRKLSELTLINADRWERARRNPDYRILYNRYKKGEFDDETLDKELQKFGFNTSWLAKPLNPFKDEQEIHYHHENYVYQTGYKRYVKKTLVDLSDYRTFLNAPLFEECVQIVTPTEKGKVKKLLEDKKYLTLKIDVTKKRKIIYEEVKMVVDFVVKFFGLPSGTESDKKNREHLKKRGNFYKVWDLRAEKKSYEKIAIELYPRESINKTVDRVKKQFAEAYGLIMGKRYKPKAYGNIFKNKASLPKVCKDCENRSTCKELCPVVLPYVDQDNVYRREWLKKTSRVKLKE